MNALKLIAAILVCQLAGVIGSVFTSPAIPGWYASLQKPFFAPPNWVFAPVWITLYTLMGLALYLVWEKGLNTEKVKPAAGVFFLQLGLNALWSVLFFGLRNPFLAFAEIIVLWISILAATILFYRVSKKAAYLMLPYLAWVSIASALNYGIWALN